MTRIDSSSVYVQGVYAVNLTTNSPQFFPNSLQSGYYYEAIEVSVVEDGHYTFGSDSNIQAYSYLYVNNFNPFDPSTNRVIDESLTACIGQFKLTHYLQKQTKYILVTYAAEAVGSFLILALGPNKVTLTHRGEYSYYVHKTSSTTDMHGYSFTCPLLLTVK